MTTEHNPSEERSSLFVTEPGRVLIGCCGFGGSRAAYQRRLQLVEVQETFFNPPRLGTLTQWRASAPDDFVFTIRAWQIITHEPPAKGYPRLSKDHKYQPGEVGHFRPTAAVSEAYRRTAEVAEALGAPAIVFETGPGFTPTKQNIENFRRFFESVDRRGRLMVWDPQGVWQAGEVRRLCEELQVLHCPDPFESDRLLPAAVYLRMRSPRLAEDGLHTLSESLLDREGFCLFNTVDMFQHALRLRALLGD